MMGIPFLTGMERIISGIIIWWTGKKHAPTERREEKLPGREEDL